MLTALKNEAVAAFDDLESAFAAMDRVEEGAEDNLVPFWRRSLDEECKGLTMEFLPQLSRSIESEWKLMVQQGIGRLAEKILRHENVTKLPGLTSTSGLALYSPIS